MKYQIPNSSKSKKARNSFETKQTKAEITQILYFPKKDQTDKELLTLEIPREKEHKLNFLKAYTKSNTIGVWKQYKDKNVQYEIQFKDSKDEKYGNRLMKLFEDLNKEEIKEEQIYARTEPIEESTLE
jgi:arsenate reductase-like glutaredoxin family protein